MKMKEFAAEHVNRVPSPCDYAFPIEGISERAHETPPEKWMGLLAKYVEKTDSMDDYEGDFRQNYCKLHIIMNEMQYIAPRFRPQLRGEGKGMFGYPEHETTLLNDHQIIDMHWISVTGLSLSMRNLGKWSVIMPSKGANCDLNFAGASRFVRTVGRIDTKTAKLAVALEEQAQCIALCQAAEAKWMREAEQRVAGARVKFERHRRRHPSATEMNPERWTTVFRASLYEKRYGSRCGEWVKLMTGASIDKRIINRLKRRFIEMGL